MASSSRTTILPQSKEALLKSYNARLKDDVRSMLENFEGKKKQQKEQEIILISGNRGSGV